MFFNSDLSESLQMSADFIFEKVYSVDPDKDRAHHISDNRLLIIFDKLSLSNYPLSVFQP